MWGCTWNDPSYSAKSSGRHKLPPVPSFSKRRGFEVAGTRCAEDDDADDDDDDDDVDDVDDGDDVDDVDDVTARDAVSELELTLISAELFLTAEWQGGQK